MAAEQHEWAVKAPDKDPAFWSLEEWHFHQGADAGARKLMDALWPHIEVLMASAGGSVSEVNAVYALERIRKEVQDA